MDTEIQAGDTVVLKSGSPKMTVDEAGDHYDIPTVWCSWFDGKRVVKDTFPETSVKKVASE